MASVKFTENERHPAGYRSRREALGLTVAQVAEMANIDIEALEKLEATSTESSDYNYQAAFSVEKALDESEA